MTQEELRESPLGKAALGLFHKNKEQYQRILENYEYQPGIKFIKIPVVIEYGIYDALVFDTEQKKITQIILNIYEGEEIKQEVLEIE